MALPMPYIPTSAPAISHIDVLVVATSPEPPIPVITTRLADPVSHFRFVAARAVDHSRAGNLDHGPSLILAGFRRSTLGYTHVLTPIFDVRSSKFDVRLLLALAPLMAYIYSNSHFSLLLKLSYYSFLHLSTHHSSLVLQVFTQACQPRVRRLRTATASGGIEIATARRA